MSFRRDARARGGVVAHTLTLEERLQMAGNPTFTTPDKEDILGHDCGRRVLWRLCEDEFVEMKQSKMFDGEGKTSGGCR